MQQARKWRLPLVCMLLGTSANVVAETSISIYTGTSFTRRSDLHVTQSSTASNATFEDVAWKAKPFTPAPYYGLKASHFLESNPKWGVSLDFTHYKMYADTARSSIVTGQWNGAPVDTSAPLGQRVQRFEISHGVNMIALNVLYRWSDPAGSVPGRLQPYVGGGPAYYLLHPESTINNRSFSGGYQGSGLGIQVLVGLHYPVTRQLGLFAEAKFNAGKARMDVADGQADTPVRSVHGIAGASWSF